MTNVAIWASAVAVLALAALLTVQISLAFGLRRVDPDSPRWLLCLLPPTCVLGPFWGWRSGLKLRSVLSALCALVYVSALSRIW